MKLSKSHVPQKVLRNRIMITLSLLLIASSQFVKVGGNEVGSIKIKEGEAEADERSKISKTNENVNQIYVDVEEADTKAHLEAIKNLPISTYKLSYERGGHGRTRVGPVGPEVRHAVHPPRFFPLNVLTGSNGN